MAQPKLPPCYQWWKGSIRVRVWVPEECRAKIGKSELVKAMETTNPKVAVDRGTEVVAVYKRMIRDARPIRTSFATPWIARNMAWMSGHVFAAQAPVIDVTPAVPNAYPFSLMIDECAVDRSGWPADRIKVIKSTFQKLAAHIGHDDAKRVSLVQLSGFKTAMLRDYEARGGTRNTVKQLLSPVKVAFKWAATNGKIDTNPAADLTVDNVRVGTRPDFTRDEIGVDPHRGPRARPGATLVYLDDGGNGCQQPGDLFLRARGLLPARRDNCVGSARDKDRLSRADDTAAVVSRPRRVLAIYPIAAR